MAAGRSNQKKLPDYLVLRGRSEQLSASAPSLLIAAERIAQTIVQGTHGRRTAGPGEDFWQYRLYASGDPANRIDWRKSARSHKIFVRENEWAAANTLWVWAASDARMKFRSHLASETKQARAALIAMTLGILAVRAGERVAALGASFAPGHTPATLTRLAQHLALQASAEFPTHARLGRFSTCVLLGDCLEPVPELAERLKPIAAQVQKGHLVQIADPAEEAFPYKGRTQFAEIEGKGNLVFGRVETLREDYQKSYGRHRENVRDLARRLGWTFTVHHTDRPPQHLLLSLYMLITDESTKLLAPRIGNP